MWESVYNGTVWLLKIWSRFGHFELMPKLQPWLIKGCGNNGEQTVATSWTSQRVFHSGCAHGGEGETSQTCRKKQHHDWLYNKGSFQNFATIQPRCNRLWKMWRAQWDNFLLWGGPCDKNECWAVPTLTETWLTVICEVTFLIVRHKQPVWLLLLEVIQLNSRSLYNFCTDVPTNVWMGPSDETFICLKHLGWTVLKIWCLFCAFAFTDNCISQQLLYSCRVAALRCSSVQFNCYS